MRVNNAQVMLLYEQSIEGGGGGREKKNSEAGQQPCAGIDPSTHTSAAAAAHRRLDIQREKKTVNQ